MKRYIPLLICLVLCLCLLTACSCSHEWQEATCSAPKTCIKCQESEGAPLDHNWQEATCVTPKTCADCQTTDGEPMGHNWQEATCAAPKTCTVCQQTEGEVLAHSYGEWLLEAESMYRVCDFCGTSESAEIDYSLYLDQHIYGHWNMNYMINSGRFYATDQLPQTKADTEICFYPDGRVSSLGFEEEQLSQSWTFDHGEYDSVNAAHHIYISFPEDNMLTSAYFVCSGDTVNYEVPLGSNGDLLVLSNRFGDTVAELISGKWSTWVNDGIYNITFHDDRSFTADIDGEITGFWQPRMLEANSAYSYSSNIMLNYLKDDKQMSCLCMFSGYNPQRTRELQKNSWVLFVDVADTYAGFNLDNEQFLTEAQAAADTVLLGTWTSLDYSVSTYSAETYTYETQAGVSADYNITLMEDGTFTANLNNVYAGTWKINSIRRDADGATYGYYLSAPGIEDFSYFQVSGSGTGYAYIKELNRTGSNYNFRQMDEAEIAAYKELIEAAPAMIVGEWFPTDGQGVSAVFNEDGTFTIQTSTGELTGNWYFRTFSSYQDTFYYTYDFETFLDSGNPDIEPFAYREDSALQLTVSDTFAELTLSSYMVSGTMTNGEGIAIMNDAAEKIIGRWSADTATVRSAEGQASIEVPGTYYIDLAEDGSFTGYADRDIQGTWEYYGVRDGYPSYVISPAIDNQLPTLTQLKDNCLVVFIDPYVIDFTR